MCLRLKRGITPPHIALKNIVCFKRISVTPSGRWLTPYKDFPVDINRTYHSKLDRVGRDVDMGLHSYKNEASARADYLGDIVVRCIIPFGSIYYKGTFGGEISYASSALKYVEELKNKK